MFPVISKMARTAWRRGYGFLDLVDGHAPLERHGVGVGYGARHGNDVLRREVGDLRDLVKGVFLRALGQLFEAVDHRLTNSWS